MTATNALFMGFKAKLLAPASTALVSTGDALDQTAGLLSITLIETALTTNTVTDVSEITHTDRGAINTAVVGTPQVMTGTTVTNPTSATIRWDSTNDVTFTAVTGAVCHQVVVWQNVAAGTNADDLLICKFGVQANGLPVTPNGGNIVVQWSANGLFEW